MVAELPGQDIVGWAALSAVSSRVAYRGVAELSIYVGTRYRRQGIGHTLLSHLIVESEKAGFWTLQAVILSANEASLALHLGCGFRVARVAPNDVYLRNFDTIRKWKQVNRFLAFLRYEGTYQRF